MTFNATKSVVIGLLSTFCLTTSFLFHYENTTNTPSVTTQKTEKLEWISWEEAVERNKTAPRKFIVDVYTDWCGWCKVMDRETFTVDSISNYLKTNFYCVKLNAERRDTVYFNNNAFTFVEQGGGRGFHTLAASLVDGNLSYPTLVYLTEKYERVMISPGFKRAPQLMPELKYVATQAYMNTSWEDFTKK
jgi:thioredoxin-related protein